MARTAILIPSLGRPQHVARVVGNIEQNTPEPHFQLWCVGLDYDDQFGSDALGALWDDGEIYVHYDDHDPDKRYVTRMNKLAEMVRSGPPLDADYVFFGSDDVVFHPFWLSRAIDVMENAPDACVVVVNDLRNPAGTQALVRTSYLPRAVFDDPGAAFHHGYHHNFADTEMFETAKLRGVIYRAMDSHVEHLHPLHKGSNQREWDKTYADAQAQWSVDAATFHERMVLLRQAFGAG